MVNRALAVGVAFLMAGCGAAPVAPSQEGTAPSGVEHTEGDDFAEQDEEVARLRAELEPAVAAFRAGDEHALRKWSSEPTRGAAYRTFGAGLLVQLGVPGSERLFIDSFPATDSDQFNLFSDFQQAIGAERDVSGDPHYMLICGAIQGWDGAIDKLLTVRALTDASVHQDNCCGLSFYAAAHPDDAIRKLAAAGMSADLVHAFEEEASPQTAKLLLDVLSIKTYSAAAEEELRLALLPVLTTKAGATAPTLCNWMKCEELGGLLRSKP